MRHRVVPYSNVIIFEGGRQNRMLFILFCFEIATVAAFAPVPFVRLI